MAAVPWGETTIKQKSASALEGGLVRRRDLGESWVGVGCQRRKKAKTRIRRGIKPPLTDTTTNQRLPPPTAVLPPPLLRRRGHRGLLRGSGRGRGRRRCRLVWGASTAWLAWHG